MGRKNNSKNANYNFSDQDEPKKRMGANDFANLPKDCQFLDYSKDHSYRDGIINGFAASVSQTSGIFENRRSPGSQDDHD